MIPPYVDVTDISQGHMAELIAVNLSLDPSVFRPYIVVTQADGPDGPAGMAVMCNVDWTTGEIADNLKRAGQILAGELPGETMDSTGTQE